MMFLERLNTYDKDQCWQYDIRVKNYKKDLEECGFSKPYAESLKPPDFVFTNVITKKEQQTMKYFIERHEWLGTLSQYTTHWFACHHKNILAGVILFNMPNAFSKILGENTKDLERLISRGACISWSPKNLASSFLMWAIKWMVSNTQYKLFTAYSDPTAKELGTIYQACNFYYMGKNSGATARYINPYTEKLVSDRYFRQKTAYKKFAQELNLTWEKNWNHNTGMNWHNIPDDIEKKLRDYSKYKQNTSKKILMPLKHKYAYVLGGSKKETKKLRTLYEQKNKVYTYPKDRGN
tara:strand:+ start:76 stop:957 length:882 start_codon:yes stop_codon:yes gene_type:complete